MTFDTHLKFSFILFGWFSYKKGALVFRAYNKTFFKVRALQTHTWTLYKVLTFFGTWIVIDIRSIWGFECIYRNDQ